MNVFQFIPLHYLAKRRSENLKFSGKIKEDVVPWESDAS